MANDGFTGLPMYVEEDPEEAAAEKQKRRQQSRKPPRLRDTPEELAKMEFNQSMRRKLYEYDPKLGASCYTRAWCLDFTEDDSLTLTGPSRGVVFLGNTFYEVDLKIKEGKECEDKQLNKALIDVVGSRIRSVVQREIVDSWRSEVELIFALVKNALEGTVEIKIWSGPGTFYGKITACTTDVSSDMLLYDSDVQGAITVGDDRIIQLLHRVVSVSVDMMLVFDIWASSSHQNDSTTHRRLKFTPQMKGAEEDVINCGLYKLQVKVVWSVLCLGSPLCT
nr:unnamed protein product [Digitaria exilis]